MKLPFLTKFSFLSLVTIIVFGLFMGWGISRYIEEFAFKEALNDVSLVSHSLMNHHLTENDLEGLPPDKFKELDGLIKEHIISPRILYVKIWNRKGVVIYSNQKNLVNRKFPVSGGLKAALEGKVSIEISSLEEEEHQEQRNKFSRLIEAYTPLILHSSKKIVGSYEIYVNVDPIVARLAKTRRFIWGGFLGGFFILYLCLFGIARNASQALVEKKELEELNLHLRHSLADLEETCMGTIQTLSAAVDAKDHYTAGHSLRVASLAMALGHLAGLSDDKLKSLEQAALFHDIGKIGTPDTILNKEGPLTPKEFKVVKKHPEQGAQIIQSIPFLRDRVPTVRFHHENFDGTGYPQGLKGEEIPLEARILKIADAYDALTSDRPYRKAKSPQQALAILQKDAGRQFDPDLIKLFGVWLNKEDFSQSQLEMIEVY